VPVDRPDDIPDEEGLLGLVVLGIVLLVPAAPELEVCAIASGARPTKTATVTEAKRFFMSGTFPRGCLVVERSFFFINNARLATFRALRAFV
jgi:hypothetical protein